ncbi:hypothetical protein DENSPDRAFT_68714 [Dentipellis sp. KUC8613]|nr:hypothetical protein DENSPDRAFT_68714 [Dentipellis sp. KUC8613]
MSWARMPRRTLLAAATAVAVSLPDSEREKLSIYPAPDQDIIVVESPTELERQIGIARRAATRVFNDTHSQVQGVIGKWIGIEQAVESRVKSLVAPDEPLTPGVLYAGIAALSGSILTRTRGLPLRILAPPTLFVLAAQQFIPKTSHNVATYAGELEERYTPGLAEKHAIGRAHFAMTVARAQEAWEQGRAHAGETVGHALRRVQETTGLKVGEAIGKGRVAALEAEGKVSEASKEVLAEVKVLEAKEVASVVESKAEPVLENAKEEVKEEAKVVEAKVEPAQNEEPKRLV